MIGSKNALILGLVVGCLVIAIGIAVEHGGKERQMFSSAPYDLVFGCPRYGATARLQACEIACFAVKPEHLQIDCKAIREELVRRLGAPQTKG